MTTKRLGTYFEEGFGSQVLSPQYLYRSNVCTNAIRHIKVTSKPET